MIPLTVLIAVTFIFTSISLRSATEQMQDEIMTENAGSIANTVATYFADYRGIMQTMMCDPAFVSLFDEIEATRITADADIKTLPSYHSAMAKLEAIAGTDRETIDLAYIIETDKCYLVYNGDVAESFPVVLERDYYLKAKAQGDIVMCDPYVSSVGSTLVVPMSAPIYNARGKMTGVAALDFALTALDKILATYDSSEGEFFLVLSENGAVIHNSYLGDFAPENVNDNGVSADLLAALEQGEGKVTFTMPDGDKVHCVVTSVGNWGWQVISGMDDDLYQEHSRAL